MSGVSSNSRRLPSFYKPDSRKRSLSPLSRGRTTASTNDQKHFDVRTRSMDRRAYNQEEEVIDEEGLVEETALIFKSPSQNIMNLKTNSAKMSAVFPGKK
eukprot:TRINITY_DN3740_c0_g1_i6.p1 TRINITY_DN3740_c0_g1~~TRINITY_DN3740_c0_g1_i6.p1  ORF type:complete len:100 (+),score=5.30 TRINITY_DN3740_c0_g1_i6:116-415(+)